MTIIQKGREKLKEGILLRCSILINEGLGGSSMLFNVQVRDRDNEFFKERRGSVNGSNIYTLLFPLSPAMPFHRRSMQWPS